MGIFAHCHRILTGVFAASLLVAPAFGQWTQTSGPGDADVKALVRSGSTIVAATGGTTGGDGAFVSTDDGLHWTATNDGLPGKYIETATVVGSDIMIGINGEGLYTLTPGSTTWVPRNSGLPSPDVRLVAASGTLVLLQAGNLVYRSTDYGFNWSPAYDGMTALGYHSISAFGFDYIGYSVVYAARDDSLYRSIDDGQHWVRVNGPGSIMCFRRAGSWLYAATAGFGVWRSTDGDQWFQAGTGTEWESVYSLAAITTDDIIATGYGKIFRTTDGGATWPTVSQRFSQTAMLGIIRPVSYLVSGDPGGIFRSTDFGFTWSTANAGFPGSKIGAIAVHGGRLFAGTRTGLYSSSDGGVSWIHVDQGPEMLEVNGVVSTGPTLYATATHDNLQTYAFRSTDNGASWTEISNGLPAENLRRLKIAGGHVYAAMQGGLYQLISARGSWTRISDIVATDITESGTDLLAATTQGVKLSADAGFSWTPRNNGIPYFPTDSTVDAVGSHGGVLFASTIQGVSRSTDGGLSWSTSSPGWVWGFWVIDNTLFGTGMGSVLRSTNVGLTWESIGAGLTPDSSCNSIALLNNQLFLATNFYGVWKRPASQLLTDVNPEISPSIPASFSLGQNYPNPFNPATLISYAIPESRENGVGSMETKLVVYDLLGREVATLVNERKMPGEYSVKFDATTLASGVYLYRLTSGKAVETKKMILLR
jgi:hypothetical protein